MLPLNLILRWAAYMAMTPNQQTLEDDGRWLTVPETVGLLDWWYRNFTVCQGCGVEFTQPRQAGQVRLYCTPRCHNRASYLHSARYLRYHAA